VTVFVPDSAVAAQLCLPQNVYRGSPVVISKKNISTLRHIPRPNGLHNKNILLFCFFISLFF